MKLRSECFCSDIYSDGRSNELIFNKPPEIGTICMALYQPDNSWYRAKITKNISATES